MSRVPATIDMSRASLVYSGSVQKLYSVPGAKDVLVSETTAGGSVFDVGTIFSIEGSDVGRAGFRHFVYQRLADPAAWSDVAKHIEAYGGLDEILGTERLRKTLADLQKTGLRTHHLGTIDRRTGRVVGKGFPAEPSNLTLIRAYQVNKPEPQSIMRWHLYDYESYRHLNRFVVPLEYIVRFGVTAGSSILRKYTALDRAGQKRYVQELGLSGDLNPWQRFSFPIIDFTTKYEPEDRNITHQEAGLMSSIPGAMFAESMVRAILASFLIHHVFAQMGLELWDLKWEVARDGDEIVFVDTIDTDSVRATLTVERDEGTFYVHFNKQAIREYFKNAAPEWYAAVNEAKARAAQSGEPFTEILSRGQQEGLYPATPRIADEFLALQERKFVFVTRYVQEGGTGDGYREEARRIAEEEVDYFLQLKNEA